MSHKKYRKLPVVIDAWQWDGTAEGATPIIDWILAHDGTARYREERREAITPYRPDDINVLVIPAALVVDTLEGSMTCSTSDWIIRGVAGEFYPCKPDIFSSTYEET